MAEPRLLTEVEPLSWGPVSHPPDPGPGIVEGRCIQWAGTTGTTSKPPAEVALPCRPGCDCHPCLVREFGHRPDENDPRA